MFSWKKGIFLFLLLLLILQSVFLFNISRDSEPQITGFYGIEWSASIPEIKQILELRFETPYLIYETHRNHPRGATQIRGFLYNQFYNQELLSENTTVSFWLRENEGLISGIVSLKIDSENCDKPYQAILQLINRQYPNLSTNEQKESAINGESFCQALATGEAFWENRWLDPVNGATITLAFQSADRIVIAYHAPDYYSVVKQLEG